MNTVDARGLPCPQPVIKTKQALDKINGATLITIVDNEVAKKNIIKLVKKLGCTVEVTVVNQDYHLTIKKGVSEQTQDLPIINSNTESGTVILCMSDLFGVGDEALGQVLIKGFFYSLTELANPPQSIIFMNKGIFLALKGSPVLDSLHELAARGTEILSCGTCLDFYQNKDLLAVGEITNMYSATEILNGAGRILRI